MPEFPRSRSVVSASGLTSRLQTVSRSQLSTGVSGEALAQFGEDIRQRGEDILKREGETQAIEDFAELQRRELTRFEEAKVARANNPDGFTKDFLDESQSAFDETVRQNGNKYYNDVMRSRYAGLQNSLVFSSTSYEAKQKKSNRQKRYASALASYSTTVYNDPDQITNIANIAQGDAAAAKQSGVFGSEGLKLEGAAAEKIMKSAINGIIDQRPQDFETYMETHDLAKNFSAKEVSAMRKRAQQNFKNIPKIEAVKNQMTLLSEKDGLMQLYMNGELTVGVIDNMTTLDEKEKEVARSLATKSGESINKDPEKLGDLMARKKDLLEESEDLDINEKMSRLVDFQNEVYNAIGKDINNTEAKALLKGTTTGLNEALEQDTAKIGKAFWWFQEDRKLNPDERAVVAIERFASERPLSERRKMLRGMAASFDQTDLEAFDDNELDENGLTQRDKQVNAIIQREMKQNISGLGAVSGTPNRVAGSDGGDTTLTTNEPTTSKDKTIKFPPERTFATVEDAEASGIKGLVLIGGRRARID